MIFGSALIFLNLILLSQEQELHEFFLKREVVPIFGNEFGREEYEGSHVFINEHSDSGRSKRLTAGTKAYGHDISKELEETNHVLFGSRTPIYVASTGVGKINYQTFSWPDTDDTRYYHNRIKRAAMPVQTEADKKKAPAPSNATTTVYPEILVVADHETYKNQKNDIYSVARYVAAFYNAFDLRFRQMTSPKIRLNIAGLVIAKDATAVPFARYGTKVDISSLKYMDQYISADHNFYQSSKVHYDLVHVFLHRPVIYSNGEDRGGVTKINSTCLSRDSLSVAVSQSTGSFVSSSIGVHELAHAFGAPHDGPESADVPGGPCPSRDGFVMSYEHSDGKSMFFSPCSITAMRRFLLSPEAKCVLNKPNVGTPGKKTLPGKLLTRDQQCSISLGNGWVADKTRETDCRVLWCAQANRRNVIYTAWAPPAEGTYCYPQYICLNGNCVVDPTKKASG